MNPLKLPGMKSLGKPRNWDDSKHGECKPLPYHYFNGTFMSYWEPSWKERLAILFGRPVRLSVVGTSHPPVWVDAE